MDRSRYSWTFALLLIASVILSSCDEGFIRSEKDPDFVDIDREKCPCSLTLPNDGDLRLGVLTVRSDEGRRERYFFSTGEAVCAPPRTIDGSQEGKIFICNDGVLVKGFDGWWGKDDMICRDPKEPRWKPIAEGMDASELCCCRNTDSDEMFDQCYVKETIDCLVINETDKFSEVSCASPLIPRYKRRTDCDRTDLIAMKGDDEELGSEVAPLTESEIVKE